MPDNRKKIIKQVIIAGVLTTAALVALNPVWRGIQIDRVMDEFHNPPAGVAEEMLMDPLILNADLVKDRVIEDMADRRMDKRRYAIGFLGNNRIREALPALRIIVADETETDLFRGDALESIFMIDAQEGAKLSERYAERTDHLGYMARETSHGKTKPVRTMAEAMRHAKN